MSKVFDFQSNEEVVVEVVQESSCEIHMVEVRGDNCVLYSSFGRPAAIVSS